MRIKLLLERLFRFLIKLVISFFIVSVFFVLLYRFVPPPATPLMFIRMIENAFEGKSPRLQKKWEPLKNISPHLVMAVITAEDQNFTSHFGFDLKAIEKARDHNLKKQGRSMRGASTITQQTAKNLFLWQGRNWFRKSLEVYFTFLIEIIWSKKRIIEVYLNIIEMGDGIYGAEAASLTYFSKSAANLSKSEAALITAVLPNPRRWSPANPTNYIIRRQQWILRNINNPSKPEFI
jgi:monofunctional glycosyltransferase